MTDLASRIQSLYEQVVTEVERAIAQYPVRQGEKAGTTYWHTMLFKSIRSMIWKCF